MKWPTSELNRCLLLSFVKTMKNTFWIASLMFVFALYGCTGSDTPNDGASGTDTTLSVDVDRFYSLSDPGTESIYDVAFMADGRMVILYRKLDESQIFSSGDNGATWQAKFKFPVQTPIRCIAPRKQSTELLFCGSITNGTQGRYYFLNSALDAIILTKDVFGPSGAINYSFNQAIWRSTDDIIGTMGSSSFSSGTFIVSDPSGVSGWVSHPPSANSNYCTALAQVGSTIYIGVDEYVSGVKSTSYISTSTNSGSSWTKYINSKQGTLPTDAPTSIASGSSGRLVFSYGTSHYFTMDGMTQWKNIQLPSSYSPLLIRKVLFDASNKLILVGDAGVLRSKVAL